MHRPSQRLPCQASHHSQEEAQYCRANRKGVKQGGGYFRNPPYICFKKLDASMDKGVSTLTKEFKNHSKPIVLSPTMIDCVAEAQIVFGPIWDIFLAFMVGRNT